MNKKIIALVCAILALVIICGIVFAVTNNKENSTENKNSNTEINTEQEQKNTVSENNSEEQMAETNNEKNAHKVLVVYFSQSGNTETVANMIHDAVGGDIVKLETVQTYPSNYNELVNYAQKEQKDNARPELKTKINNMDEYDTIFLGYPNWWGDMPMPLYTFLDEYDLSEKTIAPFITHGGSGLSGTPNKIKKEEPNANVTEGLAISGSQASSSNSTVKNWLSKIGF